jgi:GH15 family glucan-1,4-alpha-glucosidase
MDSMTTGETAWGTKRYSVEATRADIVNLIHAAHMYADTLYPTEAKRYTDSADRMSDQIHLTEPDELR